MKAAVFYGPHQPLAVEEMEIDQPGDHEVLVNTAATGVCHSDLHYVDGIMAVPAVPAVLGHEGAGVVEAVGPGVTYVEPGDHVIACLSAFCGVCDYCLRGHPNLCVDKPGGQPERFSQGEKRLNTTGSRISSFAERMLLHENAIVKIRKDMPLDRAALLGCGATTGIGAALNTAQVTPGSTVAVFGAGGVGLAVIQGARIAGARQIIAVDMIETKLKTARDLGATHTVDASAGDPVQGILDLTGDGVDFAFEAIGISKVAEQAFQSLRRGGVATVVGVIPDGDMVNVDGRALLGERRLQGSSMGSNRFRIDIPKYIDLYMQGRLDLDSMISRRGSLDDINEAFRAMKAGEIARMVLTFN